MIFGVCLEFGLTLRIGMLTFDSMDAGWAQGGDLR